MTRKILYITALACFTLWVYYYAPAAAFLIVGLIYMAVLVQRYRRRKP